MNSESAEILALQALAFILGDEKALRTLLTQTGLSAEEIRKAAATSSFQAGVLDFLTRHEDVLIAFCETQGLDPTQPGRALKALNDAEEESIR